MDFYISNMGEPISREWLAKALRCMASTIELDATYDPEKDYAPNEWVSWEHATGFTCEWGSNPDPSDEFEPNATKAFDVALTTGCLACTDGSCVHCQAIRAA